MSARATVIAQISDPHLRPDAPERADQLAVAVDAVLAAGVKLAAVLLTGDVGDRCDAADYAPVPAILERFEAPVVVIPGNHDERAGLRRALALPGEGAEPIRSVTRAGGVRIVACDTLIPGATDGSLDVPWVADQLAADRTTPTLVVMHHPPVAIASVAMDAIALKPGEPEQLAAVLADAPNVVAVLCGHAHRSARGRCGGVPVVLAPSSLAQLTLDLPEGGAFDWAPHDPPAVAFHVLVEGRLVTHVQPVARVAPVPVPVMG